MPGRHIGAVLGVFEECEVESIHAATLKFCVNPRASENRDADPMTYSSMTSVESQRRPSRSAAFAVVKDPPSEGSQRKRHRRAVGRQPYGAGGSLVGSLVGATMTEGQHIAGYPPDSGIPEASRMNSVSAVRVFGITLLAALPDQAQVAFSMFLQHPPIV